MKKEKKLKHPCNGRKLPQSDKEHLGETYS